MAKGKCEAWHAGDRGTGRDTLLARMTFRRGTGHFGTGTYFFGDQQKAQDMASMLGRDVKCLPLSGKRLFRPGTNEAAQTLFDALRAVNDEVALGSYASEAEEPATDAEFSTLWNRVRSSIPGLKEKGALALVSVLEDASDDLARCKRQRDEGSCESDSASTRLMRKLGFDGVDVRGLSGFDNSFHGSVLFRSKK